MAIFMTGITVRKQRVQRTTGMAITPIECEVVSCVCGETGSGATPPEVAETDCCGFVPTTLTAVLTATSGALAGWEGSYPLTYMGSGPIMGGPAWEYHFTGSHANSLVIVIECPPGGTGSGSWVALVATTDEDSLRVCEYHSAPILNPAMVLSSHGCNPLAQTWTISEAAKGGIGCNATGILTVTE